MFNFDLIGEDIVSEMVTLNCDMFGAWSKFMRICKFEGTDIVFKDAAANSGSIAFRNWGTIGFKFLDELHKKDDVTEGS